MRTKGKMLRNYMVVAFITVCIAGVGGLVGCHRNAINLTPAEEINVKQRALEHLLGELRSDEVLFLAFGRLPDGRWKSPPIDVVNHIADRTSSKTIRDVSEATVIDCPEGMSIIERATGRPGAIYSAEIVEVIEEDHVIVRVERFEGPLSGGDERIRMKRSEVGWVNEEMLSIGVY